MTTARTFCGATNTRLRDVRGVWYNHAVFGNYADGKRNTRTAKPQNICTRHSRFTLAGMFRPIVSGASTWKRNTMKTKKNTAGRKATTTADNSVSEYERKHPTGVTPGQRKERAGRFAALAEKIVAKMNGHDRALLDAAAETVETTAAALVAWQLTEERGLGKRRDDEAMFNRWNDDNYEAQSTLRRNNHEREVAGSTAAVFGMFGSAGLTDAEEVEVVRRYFRKGDHSLAEAEGRAIKAALAMPSPEEIEAAARIVGKTDVEFIAEALQVAIDAAKELNGGKLD